MNLKEIEVFLVVTRYWPDGSFRRRELAGSGCVWAGSMR